MAEQNEQKLLKKLWKKKEWKWLRLLSSSRRIIYI